MDTIFIGYDAREHEAAAVAAYSILTRASKRTKVYLLEHQALRTAGLFWREWETEASGQMVDKGDGRPFSTGFSHSRFLVFHLARELKITSPCMFVDCDFLFLTDISKLMAMQKKSGNKIGVTMRDREPSTEIKMDGMKQQAYHRKLWSAMFTFNPSDELADLFSPEAVSTETGRELHNFLGLGDEMFWDVPPEYHYIPSMDEPVTGERVVHYSEWSPWINPDKTYTAPDDFGAWHVERMALLKHATKTGQLLPVSNLIGDLEKG